MYKNSFKKLTISFQKIVNNPLQLPAETITPAFNIEQIIYFWQRYLELMLDTTKNCPPIDPDVYTALSKSISKIVGCFLKAVC